MATAVDETTDLLQQLIRNACVNDGTPESGHEMRSVDTLASYLQGPGVEMRRYEPSPGRGSLVLRIEGSDPKAPSLHLMGHLDVVPVTPAGWDRDPFAAEIEDGFVWGRGAIDMLDMTASMAVAVAHLIRDGLRPRGTLLYSAMADEEARGTWGAQWLTEHAWDDVKSDYLVTEFGGARIPMGAGVALPVMTGEKGSQWTRLRVRGTPGHGSLPFRSDNALVKASELVVRVARYKAPLRLAGTWARFVEGMPIATRVVLTNSMLFDKALDRMPRTTARLVHAVTRTTFSPNIAHAGVKANVIPDAANVEIDIRVLPGDDRDAVRRMLADACGDLWNDVEILEEGDNPPTASSMETPLWSALTTVTERLVPGGRPVPLLFVGATDARFFRRKGVTAYGYGLTSSRIPFSEYSNLYHGNNERVDQETLGLMTQLWEGLAREMVG